MCLFIVLAIFTLPTPTHAQDDAGFCAPRVEGAFAGTQTRCTDLPARGICYGNDRASMSFAQNVQDARFNNPGDVVGLAVVDVLELAPFNPDNNVGGWGIARANIRLNLTDDTITAWLFGGLSLVNTGDVAANVPTVPLRVTAGQGANVRAGAAVDAPVVAVAFSGATVRGTGILRDGGWVRVQTEDGVSGWVTASAFSGAGFDELVPLDDDTVPEFGSMQAFTLSTLPYSGPDCRALPPAGMLLQTPDAEQTARLRINDVLVDITPLSTVHISAGIGERLRVAVMEGAAAVTVEGEPLAEIEAGNALQIRDGAALAPAPYADYNALAQLPVRRLPRPIYLALDFDTLIRPAVPDTDPLAGITSTDACTVGAVTEAANLREAPAPGARVRRVLQVGESARPDGRAEGADGVLWWRLAADVWVSSNAVGAVGDCGALPVLPPR